MATMLSEDRIARKVGYAPESYQDFEVEGDKTVFTNSLVGVRADTGKVEPLDSSAFGTPGYNLIGFTEDHSEPDTSDEVTVAGADERTVRVEFGRAVELDANSSLNGAGDIGKTAYAASDHEFDLDDSGGSRPALGPIRKLIAGRTDRAIVEIPDISDQA